MPVEMDRSRVGPGYEIKVDGSDLFVGVTEEKYAIDERGNRSITGGVCSFTTDRYVSDDHLLIQNMGHR